MTLLFGYYSDKPRTHSPFVLVGLLLLCTGFLIDICTTQSELKYFGTFLSVAGVLRHYQVLLRGACRVHYSFAGGYS